MWPLPTLAVTRTWLAEIEGSVRMTLHLPCHLPPAGSVRVFTTEALMVDLAQGKAKRLVIA